MKSHVKWGLFFIITGIVCMFLFTFSLWLILFFSLPLILLGAALIIFGGREEKIEEVIK
jgi:hypothetical protein